MTDYDRGAYTPQTDAPLAFDPRRPTERRPLPMALIGSAAVLVILLAGVAMVYRGGVRHAGESPRPVGEPVMAVKTAPPSVSTAASSPANPDVYSETQTSNTVASTVSPPAKTPTFAPPAEQPAARPAPSAATVALLAKPAAPNRIERPATPSETAAAPAVAPSHVHARPKPDASELAAAGATRTTADAAATTATSAEPMLRKSKTLAADAPTTTAPTLSPAPGKAVVQIGAFSSSALADKGYADVSAALPDQMSGKAKHVQPLDKDGTTLYRTWLSGFGTRADAQAFCEALKAKGKTCLVKG